MSDGLLLMMMMDYVSVVTITRRTCSVGFAPSHFKRRFLFQPLGQNLSNNCTTLDAAHVCALTVVAALHARSGLNPCPVHVNRNSRASPSLTTRTVPPVLLVLLACRIKVWIIHHGRRHQVELDRYAQQRREYQGDCCLTRQNGFRIIILTPFSGGIGPGYHSSTSVSESQEVLA